SAALARDGATALPPTEPLATTCPDASYPVSWTDPLESTISTNAFRCWAISLGTSRTSAETVEPPVTEASTRTTASGTTPKTTRSAREPLPKAASVAWRSVDASSGAPIPVPVVSATISMLRPPLARDATSCQSSPPAVPCVNTTEVAALPDGSNVIDENAVNNVSRSSSLASGENPTRASNVRPDAIHRARRNSHPG